MPLRHTSCKTGTPSAWDPPSFVSGSPKRRTRPNPCVFPCTSCEGGIGHAQNIDVAAVPIRRFFSMRAHQVVSCRMSFERSAIDGSFSVKDLVRSRFFFTYSRRTTMNRIPKIILGVLALAVLVAFVTPALAVEAKGTVKSIAPDKNEFVFADKDAKNWTFGMDKDAKVLINDKEHKLADLQVGDEVTVIYEKKDNKLMASEVRCTRK